MPRLFLYLLLSVTAWPSFADRHLSTPWVGVKIERIDSEVVRPAEMGAGTGFLVEEVIPNGPLAKAGGQAGDLLWKLDDQILISTRQFLVLLGLKKMGDSVELHFFREGKLMSESVTLEKRPEGEASRKKDRNRAAIVESTEEAETTEVAEMKDGPYHLQLSEDHGGYRLIVKKGAEVIVDQSVDSSEDTQNLDRRWQSGLIILQQALAVRTSSQQGKKKKRVRYLPKAAEE